VGGHLRILHAARPIDDWLVDPNTPPALKVRLNEVKQIRAYASDKLGLPDNESYRTYADLHRPFVVWNVFAAPALSLDLKSWCFPVAGCVSYRGYFNPDEAKAYARDLASEGWDVEVAGIPAYSTLGWTPDPILSTFIDYPEGEVARLIFHELAHQLLYVAGDSTFNESFASTVEQVGVDRWLATQPDPEIRTRYQRFDARHKAFLELLITARARLEEVYASSVSDAEKRDRKAEVFRNLHERYLKAKSDPASPLYQYGGYEGYFAQDLNNAHLAAIATYTQRVPAFVKLLDEEGGDLPRFYAAVRALARLPEAERNARLDELENASGALTTTTRRQSG
jgi:predicted aminopeptidase